MTTDNNYPRVAMAALKLADDEIALAGFRAHVLRLAHGEQIDHEPTFPCADCAGIVALRTNCRTCEGSGRVR